MTLLALALCTLQRGDVDSAEVDGSVEGTVSVTKDGKAVSAGGTVVVYLRDVARTSRDEKRKSVIRQHDLQFSPRVTVVVRGTTVEFPNDDKVFHNVFSASRAARFDLGLYRSGGVKSVELKREGVVDVFCNIHPEMSSRVLVVPTHHFAIADASGKFRIDGVPPGTYPVVAWHANGGEASGTVSVAAGRTATISLEVPKQDEPEEHKRKDGTPYLRYE
ncbi:MAG: methylamine utilization protein [Kofleriaceae bacterium]|nr:methylamine utilization protein [Kofleriaceae bacterium]